jgi:hypothetical protein
MALTCGPASPRQSVAREIAGQDEVYVSEGRAQSKANACCRLSSRSGPAMSDRADRWIRYTMTGCAGLALIAAASSGRHFVGPSVRLAWSGPAAAQPDAGLLLKHRDRQELAVG